MSNETGKGHFILKNQRVKSLGFVANPDASGLNGQGQALPLQGSATALIDSICINA
ncbi:MAG: hypothetical protein HZC12_00310 [Nitrospirae bacterium]|nr:hypothetical protein [Nitrospirota bacterium]